MIALETIVNTAAGALGLDLVDIERTSRGLLRVYVDRPAGCGVVTVDDCADLSNQLLRVFAVEGIDFERLEVSSPGLDRLLKTAADFERFRGQCAKVRLTMPIANRRRFQGVIERVSADEVIFSVMAEESAGARGKVRPQRTGKGAAVAAQKPETLAVKLSEIERARLVPVF